MIGAEKPNKASRPGNEDGAEPPRKFDRMVLVGSCFAGVWSGRRRAVKAGSRGSSDDSGTDSVGSIGTSSAIGGIRGTDVGDVSAGSLRVSSTLLLSGGN